MPRKGTSVSEAAAVTLTALGFAYPPLWVAAAFAGWSIFKDKTESKLVEVDSVISRRLTARPSDPDWKSYYLESCESPAEIAFLVPMIQTYALVPVKGTLVSEGFTLDMQVKIDAYRVDFLANKWLVVEIDGFEFHGSPEAIAKDQLRDRALRSLGYSVLRIPAKITLSSPHSAIDMVRTAIAAGRSPMVPIIPMELQTKSTWSLKGTISSIGRAISQMDAFVTTAQAVQQAMTLPSTAFHAEKMYIDCALECALGNLKTEEFRNRSLEHAHLFDASLERFEKLLRKTPDGVKSPIRNAILAVQKPAPHADPGINKEIDAAYAGLLKERSEYFENIRNRIRTDRRLPTLVESELQDLGYGELWNRINF